MIDAISHGWRLVFKENHLGGARVSWGVRMVGVGVREGTACMGVCEHMG